MNSTKKSYFGRVVACVGSATLLSLLTFAPTGGVSGDASGSHSYNCVARSVQATYSTANAWQSQTVCEAGEGAIAAGGHCPGNLRAVQLSANGQAADRLAWLMCSSTGSAEWTATCCVTY